MSSALGRTFDSLSVRNYRMFFWGQVVSWTGTWVQWVAQGWLVLQITDSGFGLGLVIALQWSPVLLLGAYAGVLADRFDKRKVLIWTNVSSALLSLVLGVLTVTDVVTLWMVIVIALLLGVATALDNPARQTFTLEMVGRERLTNAVSLNTATFTTARVIGPAVAGFLITSVGIGEGFLVNAVSFIPVTIALMRMDRAELRPVHAAEARKGQIRAALRYVAGDPVLRTLLIIMAIVGTLQYNFVVIVPLLAKETFHGDAGTLGFLGAMLGAGMLIGSLGNAAFGRSSRRILLGASSGLGLFTLLTSLAPTLTIASILFVALGASSMAFLATMNSTLQLTSSDQMRGRVMALYFVLFLGSTPIGAPIVGWLAEAFDPRVAFAVGGAATLAATLYGALKLPPLSVAAGRHAPVEADLELEAS